MSRNAIPDFSGDPKSMETALRAMKELLEELTGQRPGNPIGAPSIYVRPTTPAAPAVISRGDIWIQEGSGKIRYFDGRVWREVTV